MRHAWAVQQSWPWWQERERVRAEGVNTEDLACCLPAMTLAELTRAVLKSRPYWCGCRLAGIMTNSLTVQAQIKGFELARSIYSIYELLECIMGTSFGSKAA